MPRTPKRPRDPNQMAKLIVDLATDEERVKEKINPKEPIKGQKGGLKGGKARAEKLSPERRKEIAKAAAEKRWNKDK